MFESYGEGIKCGAIEKVRKEARERTEDEINKAGRILIL